MTLLQLPLLSFPFSLEGGGFTEVYREALEKKLKEIPLTSEPEELIKHLPLISSLAEGGEPPTLKLSLLAPERPHLFKFFYDVLYAWLIPYQSMGVPLLFTINFSIPETGLKLTFCEIIARFETIEARDEAMRNFEYLKGQIALGASSSWFARRLLELKGVSLDQKAVTIHEQVHRLIERFPKTFDESLFQEMHYALLSVPDPFKEQRSADHLAKMVALGYLFKQEIAKEVQIRPDKRVLKVNLFRERIGLKDKTRPVLAVAAGVNFLDQREFLEERHLLKAIQHYLPEACLVPGSFYTTRKEASRLQFLYLEVEKAGGAGFSSEDLLILRKELPSDLNDRVERLIHPVFMPRNEEEIMRSILQVAQQVRHVSDLPHAVMTFEEQTQEELLYHVLISRVTGLKNRSFYDLFEAPTPMVAFQIEAVKKVGIVKKRYPKEVCHLRARIPKEPFLRKDLSVDLYKARARLAKELRLVLGHFRDLNGGMMAKEKELLQEIKTLVEKEEEGNEFLLENFYFSLQPIRMRTLVDPHHMAALFIGMSQALRQATPQVTVLSDRPLLLVIQTTHPFMEKELQTTFRRLGFSPQDILTATLKKDGSHIYGVIMEEVPQGGKKALLDSLTMHVKARSEQMLLKWA